ncbi:hypothetical protein QJS04_geneDACA013696 [Acorus gramineus]|uniref:Uncharacterized protein n=1 Tax=Acorus gramineus TaxID=55184 RepID=A0AAV9AW12_ACOGR|nr:hypothetical protein QJS04_geneDACA013696 [Acorus gramineus]
MDRRSSPSVYIFEDSEGWRLDEEESMLEPRVEVVAKMRVFVHNASQTWMILAGCLNVLGMGFWHTRIVGV